MLEGMVFLDAIAEIVCSVSNTTWFQLDCNLAIRLGNYWAAGPISEKPRVYLRWLYLAYPAPNPTAKGSGPYIFGPSVPFWNSRTSDK